MDGPHNLGSLNTHSQNEIDAPRPAPAGAEHAPFGDRSWPSLGRLLEAAGTGERFRFVSEPRRKAYLAILHALHQRRLAHEMEAYHDDIRDEAAEFMRRDSDREIDPQQFRSDIEQLRRWGNITERIEPTRIRSLADRGRGKLLLRLDPSTAAFLQFLEALADPLPLGLRDQGANLLADTHESLKEAARGLRQAEDASGEEFERAVLRASHLIHEADAKAGRVAAELVEFEDRLTRFVIEPFRIGDVVALGGWLERYLDRYLSALDERGLGIRMTLGHLSGERLSALLKQAEALERRQISEAPSLAESPAHFRAATDTLAALRRFFDPHHGLAEICRRINRRTRDAIRRIQRHVEAIRLRNVRTEAIRARTAELFALPADGAADERAQSFVSELIAAVGSPSDARPGWADHRAAPPRPYRRYETTRRDHRSSALGAKTSRPGQRKELERRRLERLSRFVEERLLRGRDEARLAESRLESWEDGKRLVQALTAYLLAGGRHRRYLRYAVGRAAAGERGTIGAPDHDLNVPNPLVSRRKPPAVPERDASRQRVEPVPTEGDPPASGDSTVSAERAEEYGR